MTIKIGSTSYPYLAVAKHYNLPYATVLAFVDNIEDVTKSTLMTTTWQVATWRAWAKEMDRRK